MIKIKENIYDVRAVDEAIRIFHGYETPIGTTYNAYLVIDEQITLIDFVKAPFSDVLLENIKEVIGDRAVDNIICNHVEPDHSGALPAITVKYPKAKVYGTANCARELAIYYPDSKYEFVTVKSGDTLNTGKYTFAFVPMPMVHWPDSMSAYLAEAKILFSNDALGQHIGTGEVYDTEVGFEKLMSRAGDYYANIVLPFGLQVKKLLEGASGLEIEKICPSHGVILTEFIPQMLQSYAKWADNYTDENRVVIIFDTMWGTTRKLAERLAEQFSDKQVELIDLGKKHHSYAMAQVLDAKYIFVGSPTLNNNVMPSVAAFLTYMKGLKPKARIGLAFGSYGWSGESIGQIYEMLKSCGFEMLDSVKAQWNV